MIQLAPSILSADFTRLEEAVRMAEEAGADLIHIDVMDGHFVPNLTLGPQAVSALKSKTKLPLDVHLMVDNPRTIIPLFQEAGADWISIHVEASSHLHKDIWSIKESGQKAGLVLNPATPIHFMNDIIRDLDFILIMTVNPGWGGQEFIPSCHKKIKHLKSWLKGQNLKIPVQVDGGIKLDNLEHVIQDGADIIVVGSGIYKEKDPVEAIRRMKDLIRRHEES